MRTLSVATAIKILHTLGLLLLCIGIVSAIQWYGLPLQLAVVVEVVIAYGAIKFVYGSGSRGFYTSLGLVVVASTIASGAIAIGLYDYIVNQAKKQGAIPPASVLSALVEGAGKSLYSRLALIGLIAVSITAPFLLALSVLFWFSHSWSDIEDVRYPTLRFLRFATAKLPLLTSKSSLASLALGAILALVDLYASGTGYIRTVGFGYLLLPIISLFSVIMFNLALLIFVIYFIAVEKILAHILGNTVLWYFDFSTGYIAGLAAYLFIQNILYMRGSWKRYLKELGSYRMFAGFVVSLLMYLYPLVVFFDVKAVYALVLIVAVQVALAVTYGRLESYFPAILLYQLAGTSIQWAFLFSHGFVGQEIKRALEAVGVSSISSGYMVFLLLLLTPLSSMLASLVAYCVHKDRSESSASVAGVLVIGIAISLVAGVFSPNVKHVAWQDPLSACTSGGGVLAFMTAVIAGLVRLVVYESPFIPEAGLLAIILGQVWKTEWLVVEAFLIIAFSAVRILLIRFFKQKPEAISGYASMVLLGYLIGCSVGYLAL